MINGQLKKIAIIGGGPSALFLYKQILKLNASNWSVHIFEANTKIGAGMPYSEAGANEEHITNVSGNEIAQFSEGVVAWIRSLPQSSVEKYNIEADSVTEFNVLPRLLFGEYLCSQFNKLINDGMTKGLDTHVYLETRVNDIIDFPETNKACVIVNQELTIEFDYVVICTGHKWPLTQEGIIPGYFDSPYPPSKLSGYSGEIAIRGSSLTAIDAIRTLARSNGTFVGGEGQERKFILNDNAQNFKMVMFSRDGLLPGVRFHLEDPRLSPKFLLTPDDILKHRQENQGFLSLDFIFDQDYKLQLKEKDPGFYDKIRNVSLESFVEMIMNSRERAEPFQLLKKEYTEAARSIRHKESIHWKEMLAVLSFAMNYPAKHFSAEDMLRLKKVLMPLISVIIAFVPQSSCEELLALHEAGLLELISVGEDSEVEPCETGGIIYRYTDEQGEPQQKKYLTFIDCIGQRALSPTDLPFQSLVKNRSVTKAQLKFRDPGIGKQLLESGNNDVEKLNEDEYLLTVPGIAISDNFNLVDQDNNKNCRIYNMAVPYIGGFNPDYSGLDFGEEASRLIIEDIVKSLQP